MKSEFGILGDGEKHTVTVLVDGFRLFKIENPEIEVTVDKTEAVKQIAPGVFEKKILADSVIAKVEIKGRIDMTTEFTFGGN